MKFQVNLDNNYWIEIHDDDDKIVVVGCDCEDALSDPKKVEQLRDALTEWLKRRETASGTADA